MKQVINSIPKADALPSASHDHKPMLAEGNFVRPVRVQRKRVKGWKMPENTVSVCRPTKWGNPLKLSGDMVYIDASHRRTILDKWVLLGRGNSIDDLIYLYGKLFDKAEFMNKDLQFWADKFKELDLSELNGKNLACFCPLDKPCHADVLLKIVNGE